MYVKIRKEKSMKKTIYMVLGFLFLGIGIVGIYLPLLPATPFLLISSYFFARGSKKFNDYFISTKLYRENIEPIKEKKGLSLNRKFKILFMITIFIGISIFFMKNINGRIALVLVLLFHYLYFFIRVKTVKEEKNV